MAKFTMTVFVILVCMMVVGRHADAISCQTVVNTLQPCITYLKQGGTLPANCCSGVRSLNSAASTPAARRTVCQCMKIAAKAYRVNPQYAAILPGRCNVSIGYAISYSTNCDNVH